jgi:F-type H+-transporting ATPase subunit a
MMLASANPLEHVVDQPWVINGHTVEWMSSQIAVMILIAVALLVALPIMSSRRKGMVPAGASHYVELFVVFVRERIARPAMGSVADPYVPLLSTMLAFVLGCNLMGLVPLTSVFELLGIHHVTVGGTPTGSITVCVALAGTTLLMLLGSGYWASVKQLWHGPDHGSAHGAGHRAPEPPGANLMLVLCNALKSRAWPLPLAIVGGVVVWLNSFAPAVPGITGLLLWPFLFVMEVFSTLSRCVALCIRLFANMTAGHLVLAVILGMAAEGSGWGLLYVSLPAGLGALAMLVLELLVAVIQAYVFTFLSAIFIGMAVNPQH